MTLGGGTIIDEKPLHHKRRTEKLTENLRQLADAVLDEGNLEGLILFELNKFDKPVSVRHFSEKIGISSGDIENIFATGDPSAFEMIKLGQEQYLLSGQVRQRLTGHILTILKQWHNNNPLVPGGLDLKEFAGKTGFKSGTELQFLETHLQGMVQNNQLKRVGETYALEDHTVKIDPKTKEQLQWLEFLIADFGLEKPSLNELESIANHNKINKGKLKMLLNHLAQEGKIYFNGEDFFHHHTLNAVRTKLLQTLMTKPRGINEKEFRLLIGTTKKTVQLLIPIFVEEGVIEKRTFFLFITGKGKALMEKE